MTITGIGVNNQNAAISSQAIDRNASSPQEINGAQATDRNVLRPQEAGGSQAVQQAQNSIRDPALGNLVNFSA
jgi:hypothetical protein